MDAAVCFECYNGANLNTRLTWYSVLKFIDLLKLTDSKKPYVYKNDNAPCSYWYKSGPVS